MTPRLKAPFPYFGGKSRVADIVWERFGNVKNYVEPFFGSGAVLLGRPYWKPGCSLIETVNDADGLLANFWRALAADPEGVAKFADWPVNEADLHARHIWLVNQRESLTDRLMGDPRWYDTEAAGWWVWGICASIGAGWCSGDGAWTTNGERIVRKDSLPEASSGVNRSMPHIDADYGKGINRKVLHLEDINQGISGASSVEAVLYPVAERMRRVRVLCGDWMRVIGGALLEARGVSTGIFLDPPYGEGQMDYAVGGNTNRDTAGEVWRWAIENGDRNPNLRICVAGYDDGREIPDGWWVVEWKAKGGYGSLGGNVGINAKRERLWFSPHCIDPDEDSVLELLCPR